MVVASLGLVANPTGEATPAAAGDRDRRSRTGADPAPGPPPRARHRWRTPGTPPPGHAPPTRRYRRTGAPPRPVRGQAEALPSSCPPERLIPRTGRRS
jgi:hypothetical protein